ncbi:MAG: hypothetical protein KDD25_02350 [Bdellovibrionales bacterium]|nr:hypothetical protein [Bdellovibrionales bacterium]
MRSMIVFASLLLAAPMSFAAEGSPHQLSAGLGTFATTTAYFGDTSYDGKSDDGNGGASLSGFFDLGVEYTYRMKKTMGVGAIFKYFSTSDETQEDLETSFSAFVIGGVWRHYLRAGQTEFSIGGGLGYMSASIKYSGDAVLDNSNSSVDSAETEEAGLFTTFFLIDANYWISPKFAIGIEHGTYYALGDTWNGVAASDWMINGTFGF